MFTASTHGPTRISINVHPPARRRVCCAAAINPGAGQNASCQTAKQLIPSTLKSNANWMTEGLTVSLPFGGKFVSETSLNGKNVSLPLPVSRPALFSLPQRLHQALRGCPPTGTNPRAAQ